MRQAGLARFLFVAAAVFSTAAMARQAGAAVALSPASAGVFPTQSTSSITVTLSGLPVGTSGTGSLSVTGFGAGVICVPAVPHYIKSSVSTVATTTFVLTAGPGVIAGARTVNVRDLTFGAGSASFALTILEPTLHLSLTTPKITLGSSTVNVVLLVSPDPGFGANVGAAGVPLLFAVDRVPLPPSTPDNVTAGGQRIEQAPYNATLGFPFSRTGPVVPGAYSVPVVATWPGTTGATQTASATLALNIPDVSVAPPATTPTVCNGGSIVTTNPYAFTAQYGYAGTSTLNPTSVPPGIVPGIPTTITLTAGQTLQQTFTLRAAGAPTGSQTMTLRLQDAGAVVDRSFPVGFRVINPDVSAATTSPSISLQAGGPSQSFTANTTAPPITCNALNQVDYTITGLPAGFTLPGVVSVTNTAASGYPAATLPISAGAGVTPGSYPANVHFNVPKTGQSGNVAVTVNVSAGRDFSLGANPATITIPRGTQGTVSISLTPLNGFTGLANATIPAIQSITATPSAFGLAAGQPQNVVFAVAANAAPGTTSALVNATAAGVVGTRSVTVNIVVPPPPDFTLTASPGTLTLTPGATGKITFTMTALNGWNTPTTLAIPAIPNVTAVPTTAPFPGTGGSIDVQFTASAAAPSGNNPFTATASTVVGAGPPTVRSANANIVVQPPPDFSLSVSPLALALTAGDSGPVTVTANPLYGFAGSVNVTAPALPGVAFSPSTFTLAAGAPQVVQIQTASGATPGTSPVTFSGTAAGIAGARTATFSLTIGPRPDFQLRVAPSSVTIGPTGSAQVTVFVQGLNGFAAPVDVAAPAIAGITFNPSSFTIPAGGVQTVDVVGAGAAAGTFGGTFQGSATGVTGSRNAALSVTVTGALDFQIQLSPGALVLPPGGTGTTNVSIVALNGLGGTFNVSVAGGTGLSLSPATFTLSPGGVQAVSVTAGAGASGVLGAAFTGISTQTGLSRTASLSVSVSTPDYVLSLSPSSLRLAPGGSAPVTVTATPLGGFGGSVTVVPAPPAGVDTDLKSFTLGPGESRIVTVSLAPGTGAGFFTVPFNGTAPGAPPHAVSLPIAVETAPDFTLTVTPSTISLPAGGRAPAQVTLVPLNGWSAPVDVTVTGSPGITVVPSAFTLTPGVPLTVEIRAADDAPAGAVTLFFRASGANGGSGVTVTRTVNVQVSVAAADFNVRVTPAAPSVVAGRATDLTFVLEPVGGFVGTAILTPVSMPPGASLTPALPVLSPNLPQAATLAVPRATPPGIYTLVLRADEVVSPSARAARRTLAISKTVTVPVQVTRPAGGFTVIANPASVQASPGQAIAVNYIFRNLGSEPLRIVGDTFIRSSLGGTVFDSVDETVNLILPANGTLSYSNAVLATGDMFARSGQPPVVRADRTFRAEPDATGYVDTATAPVTIAAVNPLLATASATRLSVVFPIAGSLVARGENLRAQGLIFTTGSGLFLVGWYWDGVLVETATVPVQNGTPVAVTNAVTLPTLIAGTHEITLAVLSPNPIASPPVQIYVDDVGSSLRTVSPAGGSAFVPALQPPTFSWVPVPGITAYKVGLARRGRPEELRWYDSEGTRWSPPAAVWNRLPEGEYEWTVRGYSGTGRSLLDQMSGGASVPPTSEGSPAVADGWTVSSAPARFSLGGFEARLVPLKGEARTGPGGVTFSWTPVEHAVYLLYAFERTGAETRRLFVEMTTNPSLVVETRRISRGGPVVWKVVAVDAEGRPLAATPLLDVGTGGAR